MQYFHKNKMHFFPLHDFHLSVSSSLCTFIFSSLCIFTIVTITNGEPPQASTSREPLYTNLQQSRSIANLTACRKSLSHCGCKSPSRSTSRNTTRLFRKTLRIVPQNPCSPRVFSSPMVGTSHVFKNLFTCF